MRWKKNINEMMTNEYRIKEVDSFYSSGKHLFYFVVEKKVCGDLWIFCALSNPVGRRNALKFAQYHHCDVSIKFIKGEI